MKAHNSKRPVLSDWVYAERHLMGSFDRQLLEDHAIAQLARALNTRRLVAVVGSGVSNGYGQPAWTDLLSSTAQLVLDELDAAAQVDGGQVRRFREALGAEKPGSNVYVETREALGDLAPIIETFVATGLDKPFESFSADKMTIAFEVCENLLTALRIRELERRKQLVSHRKEATLTKRYLRERLKWQLKDDRGRAGLLFARLAKQRAGSAAEAPLRQILAALSFPDKVASSPTETQDRLAHWIGHLTYRCAVRASARRAVDGKAMFGAARDGVVDAVGLLAPRLTGKAETTRTQLALWLTRNEGVENRHMIEAAFALLEVDELSEVVDGLLASAEQAARDEAGGARSSGDGADVVRAMTPAYRDPLAILFDHLRVKRVLTTNYDAEVDRLLAARGYHEVDAAEPDPGRRQRPSQASPSRALLIDGSSNRAEILTYEPGAAAYLFDYGADTREHRIQVLHIHGRARGADSWLVLSEHDYRERYARDDDPRARADDAMRLVFTANPLLFLGLGMQEPDILRPLRAFSDGVSRLCDRPAVALLPRRRVDGGERESQVVALSRYGVYYLFFGQGTYLKYRGENRAPERVSSPTLMAEILSHQDAIWEHLKASTVAPFSYRPPRRKGVFSLRDRVVEIESGTHGSPAIHMARAHLRWIEERLSGVPRRMPRATRESTVAPPTPPTEAELEALRILNKGVAQVVQTTFMTAWLRQMSVRWGAWRDEWSAAPRRREPDGRSAKPEEGHFEASRHRTLLRNLDLERRSRPPTDPTQEPTDGEAPRTDRFFAGAPSPAFQILRAAMSEQVGDPRDGRRLFYMLSRRGTGRGHVFSAMRSPRRFAHLCDWLKLTEAKPLDEQATARDSRKLANDTEAKAHARNIHSAFFNLGLSHEVLSTFDRLASFLEDAAMAMTTDEAARKRLAADCRGLRGDRLGRLRHAMAYLHRLAPPEVGPAPEGGLARAVVVINHLSVLFEKHGEPKNAQVRHLYEALIDEAHAKAPVDFIFMMNEQHLPATLNAWANAPKAAESDPHLLWLKPAGLPAEAERTLGLRAHDAFGRAARLMTPEDWRTLNAGRDEADRTTGPRTFVHFMQAMRPITLATRFFPRAAIALAHLGRVEGQGSIQVRFGASYHSAAPGLGLRTNREIAAFQTRVRSVFETRLAKVSDVGTYRRLGVAFAGEEIEQIMLSALLAYPPALLTDRSWSPGTAAQDSRPPRRTGDLAKAKKAIVDGLDLLIDDQPLPPPEMGAAYLDQIATAVGHSRYAMTIVLAAIDDMIARRLPGRPENLVDLAAVRAFVERLSLAAAGKQPEVREDIAIAQVLQLYQADNVSSLGKPLGAWPFQPPGDKDKTSLWARLYTAPPPMLFDLQERILITLALIGQPVEMVVLTGVGPVAEALDALCARVVVGPDQSAERIRVLRTTMDLLVHRCLVFRVAAKGDEKDHEVAARHRFATHKSVRRHLYRQLNAPIIDYSEVDQLTVSLYATQPSDLPRPTAEGHRRVRHLIDQLSRFERAEGTRAHGAPDPYLDRLDRDALTPREVLDAERDRIARVRLRAAYGALRSIYSIGVLSRFSSYEDEGLETPDGGYFESHRLRVRWMLRLATVLDGRSKSDHEIDESNKPGSTRAEQAQEDKREAELPVATFHAEETVWLFNECGALSLVQGRMNDAADLLSQASRYAREFVEANAWGPLLARIGLNRAVVDIQRGRLREAEALLQRIVAETDHETRPLRLIAEGYLIQIADLRGDVGTADQSYPAVVDDLLEIGRYRAAAIFAIQHADCLRAMGDPTRKALEMASKGASYAAEGGHEDIRQIGELAKVWILIADKSHAFDGRARREIEDRLDEIRDYASLMGMPRLSCSVAQARGEFCLRQGDYRAAAELAQEALRLATRYDMEMRKISALTLLGSAMLKLKMPESKDLLMRARELAYHGEYTAKVGAIEAALAETPG